MAIWTRAIKTGFNQENLAASERIKKRATGPRYGECTDSSLKQKKFDTKIVQPTPNLRTDIQD
jgi:hypothetical protein